MFVVDAVSPHSGFRFNHALVPLFYSVYQILGINPFIKSQIIQNRELFVRHSEMIILSIAFLYFPCVHACCVLYEYCMGDCGL